MMILLYKRMLPLLLTAILCLSLLPGLPCASAATLAERQQAVVATAFAYYDKGANIQYDGTTRCDTINRSDGGKTRSTNRVAPEYATPNETMFTVCSDFADQVYWESYRYGLFSSAGACWTGSLIKISADDPRSVFRWDPDASVGASENEDETDNPDEGGSSAGDDGVDIPAISQAITDLLAAAQPGDLITVIRRSGSGHTMVYVGDALGDGNKYILHSSGSHLDAELRKEKREATGSIRLSNVETLLRARYEVTTDSAAARMNLIRPLAGMSESDYPIRAATQYRVSHPRLAIERTLNKTRFLSAYPGETVTMTLRLTNNSASSYTVPVTEKIPLGTAVTSPFAGAVCDGDEMRWNVTLAAGETKTFTCDYKISATHGLRIGDRILFEGGSVGDIPSNSIPIVIGGAKLTAADQALLTSVANGGYDAQLAAAGVTSDGLGAFVYEQVLGLDLPLPTHRQVLNYLVKKVTTPSGKETRVFREESEVSAAYRDAYRMLVPTFRGGHSIWNIWGIDRCSDPLDMHLEPGDVVVRANSISVSATPEQLVYLGNGKYLSYDSSTGTYPIVTQAELFKVLFYKIYYVLRPTLLYADVHDPSAQQPAPGKTMSLNLNDVIVTNCYFADEDGEFTPGSFALVDGVRRPLFREGTEWYLPACESPAKEMGRERTVQMVGVDSNGAWQVWTPNTISVRGYAEELLAGLDREKPREASLGRVIVGMLNYGAEAQKFFGCQTDDLANKNLTAADQEQMTALAPKFAECCKDGRKLNGESGLYYASSCSLGSSLALQFYLNLPESRADRESLSFRIEYENYNGKPVKTTKSFSDLTPTDVSGIYSVGATGMAAADAAANVTLTVLKDGRQIASMTDSIASYCARVRLSSPGAKDLSDAVLTYGLAARAYFRVLKPSQGENELPII